MFDMSSSISFAREVFSLVLSIPILFLLFIGECIRLFIGYIKGIAVVGKDGLRLPRSTVYDGLIYAILIDPSMLRIRQFIIDNIEGHNKKILDSCCGTGSFSLKLIRERKAKFVVGVELSPAMHEVANNEARRVKCEDVEYRLCDTSQLDDNDGTYDYATCVFALHEMPPETRVKVLRELARVANRIVIFDYSSPQPMNFYGLRNHILEMSAGPEHYANFQSFLRQGGVSSIAKQCGLTCRKFKLIDNDSLSLYTFTGANATTDDAY